IWDIPLKGTKKLLGPPEIRSNRNGPWGCPTRAAFTPNGKTVVVAYFIGLQIATGPDAKGNWSTRSIQLPPGPEKICSFALAGGGGHVALGENKRKVYIRRLPRPGEVFLADLPETEVRVGWGSFEKGKGIIVNGAPSPNGLYMFPPTNGSSHVSYWL